MFTEITQSAVYVFLFFSIYFEVFLLITYFERRKDIKRESARPVHVRGRKYPSVTIIVPCWNEEKTLCKTVDSLLRLDYPKSKLQITIVDDGSTDGSWQVMQRFARHPQIKIYHKENGGKHTALNFGIELATTDLVGGLDADSYVDKDALKRMMPYFDDKSVMSVTPSIKVWKPKKWIQLIQNVEYGWGIFTRKMFAYNDALYVTPGPFSIFRREVFETVGGYRHAYLTEDSEMALRLQSRHMKIANAHDAHVYTVVPDTFSKLYRQRLRWTYGFLKNASDYRHLFFRREYGNLGLLVLPMAALSIISVLYIILISLMRVVRLLTTEYVRIKTVGLVWNPHAIHLDWFTFNTEFMAVISMITFLATVTIIVLSRRMAEGKFRFGRDLIYFLTLYTFMAPVWLSKAVYNAVFSVKTSWR